MTFTRRHLLAATGGAASLAALPGCVTTNAATGRTSYTGLYDPEDDVALGAREHPRMLESFGGEYPSDRLQSYVQRVGNQLATHTEYQFPYRFTLLNSPIVNAFALPGGYVYVSRGLLALGSNEAELAGVLAHELGHVNARHAAERLSAAQAAQIGVIAGAIGASVLGLDGGNVARVGQGIAAMSIQSYSRKQEFEADMLGVRYMSKAGYDPEAMVTFLATLREQSIVEARSLGLPAGSVDQYNMMSTHPRTVDRVREATAAAAAQRPAAPRTARAEYLGEIDGMTFGDDPAQGVVIGRRFVHPGLGFEFLMPAGFRVQNAPDRVVARNDSGAAVIFDIAQIRGRGDMRGYVAREWGASARLRDLEPLTVNGLEAGTAWTSAKGPAGNAVDVRLVAMRRDARTAYRLTLVSPRDQTARLRDAYQETTFSFRALSSAEAAAVRPLVLRVVRARSGDRVERLATPLPFGRYNADWFRVMNDLPSGAQPTPGEPLKIVVA